MLCKGAFVQSFVVETFFQLLIAMSKRMQDLNEQYQTSRVKLTDGFKETLDKREQVGFSYRYHLLSGI